MTLVKINWSLHFSSEVLRKFNKKNTKPPSKAAINPDLVMIVFLLPLPLISGLRLSQGREKAGVLVVFTLGAITISVSLARFIAMLILESNIMICKFDLSASQTSVMLT